MNPPRAFIFDLDGVIVDTAKYHYLAWKRLANDLGFDLTPEQNERLKGVSRMASLEIILKIGGVSANPEDKERFADQKNRWYMQMISRMRRNEILPDADRFVRAAREKGLKIALGSASKNARTIVNALGIIALFDAIVDGNRATKAKPDPEVFLKAAEMLGVRPKECVVFEDAAAGIAAARAGSMPCVGIGSPARLYRADIVLRGLSGVTPEMVLTQLALIPEENSPALA